MILNRVVRKHLTERTQKKGVRLSERQVGRRTLLAEKQAV